MSTTAVVVNGVPGAGKTTLCTHLGRELGLPVVAKDAVKEALAEVVDTDLPTRSLGAIASDTLWALVGLIDGPVIVESFWLTGRDEGYFADGLRAGGVRRGVEVWCEAPLDVMRQRFTTRPRHFAHHDADRHDEWEAIARVARPISSFPVIRVETSAPVEVAPLAAELRAALDL